MTTDPLTYLAWCARQIRHTGWVSTIDARLNDDVPTHELATASMADGAEQLDGVDMVEAEQVFAWMATRPDDSNDYHLNLRTLTQKDAWTLRDLPLACSAVASVYRAWEIAVEREERDAVDRESMFIGTVGERPHFGPLTVTWTYWVSNEWGGKTLIKMKDAENNVVTWWSSSNPPERGDVIEGKATIKDHEVYRGCRQTVITRFSWVPARQAVAA
jgi:hypothetical protein